MSTEEATVLGPLIRQVYRILQDLNGTQRLHLASYGEGVRHVHFLIIPRTTGLPASNIHLTYWILWRRWSYQLGSTRTVHDESRARELADWARQALAKKVI